MDNATEKLDIAIVGAGWHGLAMAKTYREIAPNAHMMVLDAGQSLGGTWAKERLYPGLKTNNLLGTYEYSDFPMTPERFDVQHGQHIPGHAVHDYLVQFAEHFSLSSLIQLRTKVESAQLLDDGTWELCVSSTEPNTSDQYRTIIACKLVVATGLTSEPYLPKFTGEDQFNRNLFHAKELKNRAQEIESAKSVAVLGGNKSAWDTCFFAAQAGAHVHMIIRPGGGGPSWIWPVLFSPFNVSIQRLAATRFFTWFDPCIWSERDGVVGWIRKALHETYLGRKVVSLYWEALQGFAYRAHRYDELPEMQKLKPWVSPFWMGNSLSIHNYSSSWFDLVREGKIMVHIADVTSLTNGTIHLSNGEDLNVDKFVCCTGWTTRPPIRFLPEGIDPSLGLQYQDRTEDHDLIKRARAEIYDRLPAVRGLPSRTLPPGTIETKRHAATTVDKRFCSYRLYRFLVPADKELLSLQNVAFIGSHLALNAIMIAQLQALWISAYFTDKLPHLHSNTINYEEVKYETVLHCEYTRIRHPHAAGGSGDKCPDLTFDCEDGDHF
ncbi:hypothetical protein G7054_g12495 [Neopestalotiopsis clavispora]|nr:hypothetical protein G7054_g12495 [Neopestalotiopsis clavispora]